MNTILTLQVREKQTGWNLLTIGRVTREKRSFALKNLAGQTIFKSSSFEKVTDTARRFANQQGYFDGAFAQAV